MDENLALMLILLVTVIIIIIFVMIVGVMLSLIPLIILGIVIYIIVYIIYRNYSTIASEINNSISVIGSVFNDYSLFILIAQTIVILGIVVLALKFNPDLAGSPFLTKTAVLIELAAIVGIIVYMYFTIYNTSVDDLQTSERITSTYLIFLAVLFVIIFTFITSNSKLMNRIGQSGALLTNINYNYIIPFTVYIIALIVIIAFNPYDMLTMWKGGMIALLVFIGIFNIAFIRWGFVNPGFNFDSLWNIFKNSAIIGAAILILILVVAFIMGLFGDTVSMPIPTSSGSKTGDYVIFILMILSVAVFIYKTVIPQDISKHLANSNTLLLWNFIVAVITYIPCFLSSIMSDLKHTKQTEYILLAAQCFILILYFVVYPRTQRFTYLNGGNQLLNGPASLKRTLEYSIAPPLRQIGWSPNEKGMYQYGLSFWYYLDVNAPSQTSSNILSVTYAGQSCPSIKYDRLSNSLMFYCNEDLIQDPFYVEEVKLQKWNNIVINYDGGIIDIFSNGKLVHSTKKILTVRQLSPSVQTPTALTSQTPETQQITKAKQGTTKISDNLQQEINQGQKFQNIDLGEPNTVKIGGNPYLNGKISNIMYYDAPRTLVNIENSYKLLLNNSKPFL